MSEVTSADVESVLTTPAYHKWLGLELASCAPGDVTVRMPYREEFLADVDSSYVHGGLLATLADIAGDFAFVSQLGVGVPTVDLRIDYLRAARPEVALLGRGTVVRRGRKLGVADVVVTDTDGREIAVGRGLYAMPPGGSK